MNKNSLQKNHTFEPFGVVLADVTDVTRPSQAPFFKRRQRIQSRKSTFTPPTKPVQTNQTNGSFRRIYVLKKLPKMTERCLRNRKIYRIIVLVVFPPDHQSKMRTKPTPPTSSGSKKDLEQSSSVKIIYSVSFKQTERFYKLEPNKRLHYFRKN